MLLFVSVDEVVVMVDEITYGDFIGTHDIEADCCTDECVIGNIHTDDAVVMVVEKALG
jgi:hypothetical protein